MSFVPIQSHMKRALALARRGAGRVSPNPMVGAVVVKDGRRVGEGYHLYDRRDHAEILALREAGSDAKEADLYLTLEPCAHQGRTPPCVEQITKSRIGRVIVATLDPNPQVRGKGIQQLRNAGIEIEIGLCGRIAERLNESFFHYITRETPFVRLKLAMTLDGKIATEQGSSKWITGEESRRLVHRLRYESDAILVGVETVLLDDPSLDVRWHRRNAVTKVVLDTHLRMPAAARIFDSSDKVIIFHGSGASKKRQGILENRALLIPVSVSDHGLELREVFEKLGEQQITSLLIEGGAKVAASAVRGGHVNSVALFYGPKLMGGTGLSSLADLGVQSLDDVSCVNDMRVRRLGQDFLVEGYLR